MGLIINDKIRQLMKGYPTVSDKYNIAGGTLTGNYTAEFGTPVKFSDTKGYFEAINANNTIAAVTEVAGFILATNIKLANEWPGETVVVKPGEAFNLTLPDTFMAVELIATAKEAEITANAAVKITANGDITTNTDDTALAALPNVVFTGTYEKVGTKIYAEIYIK